MPITGHPDVHEPEQDLVDHAAVRGLLVAVCALLPFWALLGLGAVVLG